MDIISLALVIIGSINWGIVSLFQFDFIAWLGGGQTAVVSRVIYGIIGLAGIWCINLLCNKMRRTDCGTSTTPTT